MPTTDTHLYVCAQKTQMEKCKNWLLWICWCEVLMNFWWRLLLLPLPLDAHQTRQTFPLSYSHNRAQPTWFRFYCITRRMAAISHRIVLQFCIFAWSWDLVGGHGMLCLLYGYCLQARFEATCRFLLPFTRYWAITGLPTLNASNFIWCQYVSLAFSQSICMRHTIAIRLIQFFCRKQWDV